FLLGEIHYLQDRLPEALHAWEEALRRRDHPAVRARVEKVRRELSTEGEYERVAGGRFRVRFEGGEGSGDLPRQVLEYLEERVGDLSLQMDHFPSAPLSVVLYPEEDFHDATLTSHAVRGVFDGKIRIPLGGESRITEPLRNTLDHELAHALIDSKTAGNCPRWLHEGIAQHLAGDRSKPFRAALAGEYRRLSAEGGWHPGISYPAALGFVEFLADRHGFTAWLGILDRMGEGASFEDALFATLRLGPREAFDAWGEALLEETRGSR
ncbi:MAG: hypothetical protein HY509_05930, partial [Acidobacteria bacterium]|nr:hypothetical protein [Acidobacteriota bacterium]